MAIIFSDSFTGSGVLGNITVGGVPWQIASGTWSRSGGKAVASQAPDASPVAVIDTASPNVDISLNVSDLGGDALYFRVNNTASEMMRLRVRRWTTSVPYSYTEYQYQLTTSPNGITQTPNHIAPETGVYGSQVHQHGSYYLWAQSRPYVNSIDHDHGYDQNGHAASRGHVISITDTGQSRQINGDTETTNYQVILEKLVSGAWQTSTTYDVSNPTTLRVTARGSIVSVYVNGSQKSGVTDTYGLLNTRHGIGKGGPSELLGSSIDNFSLTVLVPPQPVIVLPTNGAVFSTDTPTLQANVTAWDAGNCKIEYQISSSLDFTTELKTYIESDSALRASGLGSLKISDLGKLSQRNWWVRARQVASTGEVSDWNAAVNFSVAHPPGVVNLRPTNGVGVAFASTIRLSWVFADTSETDSQTAYRVLIERNDNAQVVIDTNKVLSQNQFYDLAVDQSLRDVVLRWKIVNVWDQEDKPSLASSYNLFVISNPPGVSINSPASGVTIVSNRPLVSWSFTSDAGRSQAYYRVVYTKQGAVTPKLDSGTLQGSDGQYNPPVAAVENNTTYDITVYVTDSIGVVGSSTVTVPVAYDAPSNILYTAETDSYETDGYVKLSWQGIADPNFVEWRVYRRMLGDTLWKVVGSVNLSGVTEFKDWQVPSMETYEYFVVQVAERFGENVESDISSDPILVILGTGGYWLIDPIDSQNNTQLFLVKDNPYSNKFEQAELTIVGRGRHVDIGEEIGVDGSLTAQLRDSEGQTARSKKLKLESLRKKKIPVYLRNPFGDISLISLGDIDITRVAGVGSSEFVDVTIPYLEIF